MVVVVIYRHWLIGWCQSVVGRCGAKLLPFCRSWILVILVACIVTAIAAFRVVVVAADLFIPLALMLFSLRLSFLIIAVIFLLSYRFYCYLLSLLLLLWLLLLVLTAKWSATSELL
jgi:hypothetical protein